MKEPLNGNLALNFLFKNSDIGELIKSKSTGTGDGGFIEVSRASSKSDALYGSVLGSEIDEAETVPPHKVPGYYKKKNKIKIGNINDFLNKVRRLRVVSEYFNHDDPDFGGIKQLLADFMAKVKNKIMESPYLKNDVQNHMDEIHSYVI